MNRSPFFSRRGFTLIEVMLSIAVLVLLAGGMFGAVRAVAKGCAALREAQGSRDAVDGLFNLCQATLPALPPAATLAWVAPGQDAKRGQLIIRNAPRAFAVGGNDAFFGEAAVVTRTQNNGGLVLGIEYRKIDPQTNQTLPNPLWLPLVVDLRSVAWAFFDVQTGKWQETWDDPARRPSLIRLTLAFLGGSQEWSRTFWLPKLVPVPSPSAPGVPTPAPATP